MAPSSVWTNCFGCLKSLVEHLFVKIAGILKEQPV